ncbi:MAG: PqqD family protein, partial [Salinisphaera sp.]|nr:PqqD family protein [Salinisphaera sp.]
MTDGLQDDSSFRANDHEVAAKVVDGEAILINLANGVYYSMDKVGGLAWSMIAGTTSITGIAEAVAAHYSIPVSKARTDARNLAEELLAEGLIVLTGHGER